MKIAIQSGMHDLEMALKEKGYEVVAYEDGGTDIKITIINDVDEAYEEIDPVTFYGTEEDAMVLLDASALSREDVLKYVDKYMTQ